MSFGVCVSQGQGGEAVEYFATFEEAYANIKRNVGSGSFAIKLPNGSLHEWTCAEEEELSILWRQRQFEIERDI